MHFYAYWSELLLASNMLMSTSIGIVCWVLVCVLQSSICRDHCRWFKIIDSWGSNAFWKLLRRSTQQGSSL